MLLKSRDTQARSTSRLPNGCVEFWQEAPTMKPPNVDLVSGGANSAKLNAALGFLTVVEHPQHGLFGGYLLLNLAGRPLEFHCTTPVKPNRAQQILFGPTLEPYLFGEQIGRTLLASAKIEPRVVCTDREPALAVGQYVDVPVVLVLPPDASAEVEGQPVPEPERQDATGAAEVRGRIWRLDGTHASGRALHEFRLGRNRLAVPEPGADQRRLVTDQLSELSDSFDLAEPFERIREAIEEARRQGG
jgi:hypothetical protein